MENTKAVPAHLQSHRCYVCGNEPHEPTPGAFSHAFWSNEDAAKSFQDNGWIYPAQSVRARYASE